MRGLWQPWTQELWRLLKGERRLKLDRLSGNGVELKLIVHEEKKNVTLDATIVLSEWSV